MDPNQFNIVHKEVNSQYRTIKEAMFIHVQDPPSTETWANTNCCIYGTSSYMHHQCSSPSQLSSQPLQPTHNPPTGPHPTIPPLPPTSTLPLSIQVGRATYFFLFLSLLVSTPVLLIHPLLFIYI